MLCPDANGNEGLCPETYAESNADNVMLVAAGLWFSNQCGKIIPVLPPGPTNPLPPGPTNPSPKFARDFSRRQFALPNTTDSGAVCNITYDISSEPLSYPFYGETNTTNHANSSSSVLVATSASATPRFPNTTATIANATATASALPCYNYEDPDNGGSDFCTCSNGASTSVAAKT